MDAQLVFDCRSEFYQIGASLSWEATGCASSTSRNFLCNNRLGAFLQFFNLPVGTIYVKQDRLLRVPHQGLFLLHNHHNNSSLKRQPHSPV